MQNRITSTPTNPKPGDKISICYDFDGLPSGLTQVTLSITSEPQQPGEPVELTFDRATGGAPTCKFFQTSASAIGLTVVDLSGNSNDHGIDLV